MTDDLARVAEAWHDRVCVTGTECTNRTVHVRLMEGDPTVQTMAAVLPGLVAPRQSQGDADKVAYLSALTADRREVEEVDRDGLSEVRETLLARWVEQEEPALRHLMDDMLRSHRQAGLDMLVDAIKARLDTYKGAWGKASMKRVVSEVRRGM